MNKAFVAESLNRRPALLREVLRFNGVLISDQDAFGQNLRKPLHELVPGLPISTLSEVFQARRARRQMRRMIASEEYFWDFEDEPRRLALLDAKTASKLVMTFGTAVHASDMAKIVLHDEVLELRQKIGQDLHEYAVYRGQFQLGSVMRFFKKRDTELSLCDRVRKHGILAFCLCATTWPEELRKKVAPRLPFGLEPVNDSVSTQTGRAIWLGLKKILVKEVAPQWAPCFA